MNFVKNLTIKTTQMEKNNDYVLYDKANNHIVTFSNGEIVFYADKQEAINDKYGNEIVIKYSELIQNKYK